MSEIYKNKELFIRAKDLGLLGAIESLQEEAYERLKGLDGIESIGYSEDMLARTEGMCKAIKLNNIEKILDAIALLEYQAILVERQCRKIFNNQVRGSYARFGNLQRHMVTGMKEVLEASKRKRKPLVQELESIEARIKSKEASLDNLDDLRMDLETKIESEEL